MPKYIVSQPAITRCIESRSSRSPTTTSAPMARNACARSSSFRTIARTAWPCFNNRSVTVRPTAPTRPAAPVTRMGFAMFFSYGHDPFLGWLRHWRVRINRLAARPAAEQIGGSTQLQQRVVRRLNPLDARDRVEDDFSVRFVIRSRLRQSDRAQGNDGPRRRPVHCGVIDHIAIFSDLDLDIQSDGAPSDAFLNLVEQVIGSLGLCRFVVQMLEPCLGDDAIATITRHTILVDESKRGHAEEGFRGEAGRAWLRGLREGEGGRVVG